MDPTMNSLSGMARPLRIQEVGLTYHVTARGNAKMAIFLDDTDRRRFLEILGVMAEIHQVQCSAHCIMNNHYHLVARTTRPNLSKAIQALNGTYAHWWNRRHRRVGHMFQGRFGAQVVQDDQYLLTACRYVVLNPVRAKMVDRPEDWDWSSYKATAGLVPAPPFLCCDRVLDLLGECGEPATVDRYRAFINSDPEVLPSDTIVGSVEFVERFRSWRRTASREVPRRQTTTPLNTLFSGAVTRASRNAQMVEAHRQGYSLAAIARFLEVHYTTVSKIISASRGQILNRQFFHGLALPSGSDH